MSYDARDFEGILWRSTDAPDFDPPTRLERQQPAPPSNESEAAPQPQTSAGGAGGAGSGDNGSQGVGLKFDGGKPRMSLLPFDALVWVARVLTFGAKKYKAHSWRTVPNGLERYTDAFLRHYEAIQRGEVYDVESGLPHWAHLACNVLFGCALACAGLEPKKEGR